MPRKPRTSGVERAFQVLECMVELGESATAYQVAKTIGAPLSTIYESIALLEKMDVLAKYGGEGKYFLGPRLLIYGLAYQRHLQADEVYRREADALSHFTGENVQICIRDGDHVVVAAVADGGDQFQISSRTGTRTPLNWNASGILLLGHMAAEERAEFFRRARPSPTGKAIVDPTQLEKNCREAWERGWYVQAAESDFAVSCIAAPVLNPLHECVATISLVVPEMTAMQKGRELAGLAVASARNVEKHLGWQKFGGEGKRLRWGVS